MVLNEIINQIKNIKSEITELNTKFDFIYKNTNKIPNYNKVSNFNNNIKNKEKNIIQTKKFEPNQESEEDLENELNKYI